MVGGSSDTHRCEAGDDAGWGTATTGVKPLCASSGKCPFAPDVPGGTGAFSTVLGPMELAPETGPVFTLRVYERLPQPTIRCDAQSCANGLCNTTLSCTVPSGGSNVTYSWSPPQPPSTTAQGSIMVISHPDPLINVTCTAHNPVSNNSTTASVKALCAASSLSYCQAQGHVLLQVLGALITGTPQCPADSVQRYQGCMIWTQKVIAHTRGPDHSMAEGTAESL
ncbi:PREDICTED: T-lymphocyte surface antigen Ly-9-like [Crocodylus porosus]|uniref:T-lymphocyte surface antigen Ly-9-like n=1 Tax=Crocodylus porosus TaxID=8502 RepID=UPI00093D567B|nr:PREDICTED: T-lymphocyte surface antigen Ly-9-like [Crocodylus porosus]